MEKNEKECFKNLEPKAFERVYTPIKGGIKSDNMSKQQAVFLIKLISELKTTEDVFLVMVSMFAMSNGKELAAYQDIIKHLLLMKMLEEFADEGETSNSNIE